MPCQARPGQVRPLVSTRVKQCLEDHSLRTALNSSDSPDLLSRDFFIFGYVKRVLQGFEFQSVEERLETLVRILNVIPTDTLIDIFHDWIKKLQAYIDNDGEYVESRSFESKKLGLKSTEYRDAKGDLYTLYQDGTRIAGVQQKYRVSSE
jgi:hypothetical protein